MLDKEPASLIFILLADPGFRDGFDCFHLGGGSCSACYCYSPAGGFLRPCCLPVYFPRFEYLPVAAGLLASGRLPSGRGGLLPSFVTVRG